MKRESSYEWKAKSPVKPFPSAVPIPGPGVGDGKNEPALHPSSEQQLTALWVVLQSIFCVFASDFVLGSIPAKIKGSPNNLANTCWLLTVKRKSGNKECKNFQQVPGAPNRSILPNVCSARGFLLGGNIERWADILAGRFGKYLPWVQISCCLDIFIFCSPKYVRFSRWHVLWIMFFYNSPNEVVNLNPWLYPSCPFMCKS